jgi:hypothetical protein
MKKISTETMAIYAGLILAFAVVFFVVMGDGENDKPKITYTPVEGVWKGSWNGNIQELKINKDSTMTMVVKQLFCPGTRIFYSLAAWRIEHDSLLVMYTLNDAKQHKFEEVFPELMNLPDTCYLKPMDLTGTFLLKEDRICNLSPQGVPDYQHYYLREK